MLQRPMSSGKPLRRAPDGQRAYEIARLRLARLRVTGGASLQQVLRQATKEAAQTLAVERVGIWLFINDRRAIRCYQVYERSRNEHSEGAILWASDFPSYFRALEERRDIPADEASTHTLTHELREAYLAPLGITSMLDAPIYREGTVVGVVCHEHAGPTRHWTDEERDFAGSVADQIALRMEEAARLDAEMQLRAYQEHALDLEKQQALERLAAGVAHDFRNILTAVLGSGLQIADDPRASREIAAHAQRIIKGSERGVELARELETLGCDEARATRVIDVGEALDHMADMLQGAAGRDHPIHIERSGPAGRVFIDRLQLERVVLNLVLNARDAMPGGGTIRIRLGDTTVADRSAPGVYVVIAVSDSGVGIDGATRAHIFEPFFSTKPKEHNSGLGLSVVHQVVDRCGGFLQVESQPGGGSTFRVYLPRVAASPR